MRLVSLVRLLTRSTLTLTLTLSVDLRSEGILVSQGELVDNVDPDGEQNTSRLAIPQRGSKETAGRASVHGRASHVEGKASHHLIHKKAKVVTEECTSNAKSPSRGDDQDIADSKESGSSSPHVVIDKGGMRRLFRDGILEN